MKNLPFGLALFLLLCVATPGFGQTLSDEARVSVLTILPGEELYSAWAHTGIRVMDSALDLDLVFNYGTFDFDQPNFYLNFLRGHLNYTLSADSYPAVLRYYRAINRPVIEQTLGLDADARQALFDFLVTNYQPQNRGYRYDFLFDNCATRPRDVIEHALGARLVYGERSVPPATFRQLIDAYLLDRPWIHFGIDLLLGATVDRTATPHERLFLPIELKDALAEAVVLHDDGLSPLVAQTDTIFWIEGAGGVPQAFPWPAALGWLLVAGSVGVSTWRYRTSASPRDWPDVLLFTLVGLAGLIMLVLWVGTDHHVTAVNWNLLWAWPTHLAAAFVLPRVERSLPVRVYLLVTCVTASGVVLGWWFWPQALPAGVWPLVVLVAFRSGWRVYAARRARLAAA